MQTCVHVGYNPEDLICVQVQEGWRPWSQADQRQIFKKRLVYLEELELERERWRLRPGDLERERRRAGERLLGERDLSDKNTGTFMMGRVQTAPDKNKTSWNNTQGWSTNLLLMRGGLLRHIGGGGGILRGGESLRGGGRTRWVRTAEAVISWPSIWPEKTKIIESSELLSKSGRSPSPNYSERKHSVTVRNQTEKQNEWLKQSLRNKQEQKMTADVLWEKFTNLEGKRAAKQKDYLHPCTWGPSGPPQGSQTRCRRSTWTGVGAVCPLAFPLIWSCHTWWKSPGCDPETGKRNQTRRYKQPLQINYRSADLQIVDCRAFKTASFWADLGHVPGQPPQVNFSRFWARTPFPPLFILSSFLCFRPAE